MARRKGISAYRLYDRDIPEFPYILEIFNDFAVISLRLKAIDEEETKKLNYQEFLTALDELGYPNEKRVFKKRIKSSATEQYTKNKEKAIIFNVNEGDLKFQVNLNQYLDTGLFLDHRPLRQDLSIQNLSGKKYLNLFCYTGSLSVALAKAGATVTSVDLSKTYLEWAKTNFKLNDINFNDHEFIDEDCLGFLKEIQDGTYDGIIIDPPTFSVSKKFKGTFDVERDHSFLIRQANKALKKDGIGYFSNNLRSFKMDEELQLRYGIKDVTFQSIPEDFHDKKIHQAYTWTKQ